MIPNMLNNKDLQETQYLALTFQIDHKPERAQGTMQSEGVQGLKDVGLNGHPPFDIADTTEKEELVEQT